MKSAEDAELGSERGSRGGPRAMEDQWEEEDEDEEEEEGFRLGMEIRWSEDGERGEMFFYDTGGMNQ